MFLSDNKTVSVCPDDYHHASNESMSAWNATFEAEIGGGNTPVCYNSTSLPPSAIMCRAENEGDVGPWYVCAQDEVDGQLVWQWIWRALLLIFTLLIVLAWWIGLQKWIKLQNPHRTAADKMEARRARLARLARHYLPRLTQAAGQDEEGQRPMFAIGLICRVIGLGLLLVVTTLLCVIGWIISISHAF